MRKRPQPAKKVSGICEKDHKKLLLARSTGRDKDRNEIAIAFSEEKSTEIEKPEKNCGLFHMEKENKEINKWKRPQNWSTQSQPARTVVKTTFLLL